MDYASPKYDKIRQLIKDQYYSRNDWDSIKKLDYFEAPIENILSTFSVMSLHGEKLTPIFWEEMVDYVQQRDKERKVVKLGRNIKSDASIPQDEYSAWQLYKKKLLAQKWSENSIENIEKSSFEILQNLSMNTVDDGPVKGLVVGNVQSGKTANMAGLMSMAADNGFNYFIVLSGVIESLRKQTSKRLFEDMTASGQGNLHWNPIENPSLKSTLPEHNISNFNLASKDKDRYFTVCLKNKSRLTALKNWLFSDANKAKQLKILIIDDEADQASVNTKPIEGEEYTAINKLIRQIVNTNKVAGMNYISYTATPYANVLNETSVDSLYPKDFIVLLEPSEDYIGPRQLFGTEIPEVSPYIDIVEDIPDIDSGIIKDIQEGNIMYNMPGSFVKAIHWFLLTVSAMRALDYNKPISMLVHTSFKISHHEGISKKIQQYLQYFQVNYDSILPQLKNQYEDASIDFKRSHFLAAMPQYSTPGNVPDYPKWELVQKNLDRIIRLPKNEYVSHIQIGNGGEPKFHKGIHLVIDNSKPKANDQYVRLVYPTDKQMPSLAPAFIVVGGNTLSRGLTLEGLTTTFFLRTTNQADTLMQMGRWFGYRKGYEIFPRVWLDRKALNRYSFLSQMNEELRDEIGVYAENGLTPADYAPRIKNSSNYNLIRITSSNKMQSAEAREYDFAGFNTQTIYFEKDEVKLEKNLYCTKKFLNNLPRPHARKNHLIWRGVDAEQISTFLKEYQVCSSDTKMTSLPVLLRWVQENAENLEKWNVVLSGVGHVEGTEGKNPNWNIHGYSPGTSERTKLKHRSTENLVSIGSLRSPSDLLADIENELSRDEFGVLKPSEVQAVREKHGYGKVPQLLIYRIDKGEMTEEEYVRKHTNKKGEFTKSNRAPLNFPMDLIGINIMIPGMSKGGSHATYVSATLDIDAQNQNIDETQFEEEIE